MYLVLAPQTILPPFTILMVLVMSCLTRFFFPNSFNGCAIGYSFTWSLQYRLVRFINPITSLTPTSSDSVELLVFTFCPDNPEIGDSVPRVNQYPVWPFMSMWTANEASMLHTIFLEPSDSRIKGRWIVAHTYQTSLPSFFQSSIFGHFTRLHRNATATYKLGLAHFVTYKIWQQCNGIGPPLLCRIFDILHALGINHWQQK